MNQIISQQDFEKYQRFNDLEVFTENQMSEAIKKSIPENLKELTEEEQEVIKSITDELSTFSKVEVVSSPEKDSLNKSLVHTVYYVREKQVEWTEEEITKSVDGEDVIEKAKSGIYKDTPENRKKGRVGQKFGSKKLEGEGDGKKESMFDSTKRKMEGKDQQERINEAIKGVKMFAGTTGVGKVNINSGMVKTFAKMYDLEPERILGLINEYGGGSKEWWQKKEESKSKEFKSKEELEEMSQLDLAKYSNSLRMKRNSSMGKTKELYQKEIDLADSFREGFGKESKKGFSLSINVSKESDSSLWLTKGNKTIKVSKKDVESHDKNSVNFKDNKTRMDVLKML